ncbi:MAG: helix-turn-helix domain-containing protein [Anaerolineae bacterium]|nr:helix-turn-helix domain-containing protein [Anaerolineae bacterium]
MSENPTPEMLTVAQVAEYLHLHALTVRRLLKDGTIPARKVGREWRINRVELNRWIVERTRQNSASPAR